MKCSKTYAVIWASFFTLLGIGLLAFGIYLAVSSDLLSIIPAKKTVIIVFLCVCGCLIISGIIGIIGNKIFIRGCKIN